MTDFAISEAGDLLFVSEGEALTILQLDDQAGPATVLSRISPNQGRIQGIEVVDDVAYVITPIGLAIIDVQDARNPVLQSFLPGGGESIQVANRFAFVAARAAGLRVIGVADPRHPVLAGTLPVPGKALAVQLDLVFNLAYVAADEGGLRVVDISAPDLPRELGSLKLPGGVQHLELHGDRLALSSGDRILLVDVSRPDNPILLGEYAPPREARRVGIRNDLAFVADLDGGLKVLDLANPAMPLLIYGETEGATYDVLPVGNRLYVADGAAGVRILDIGNPAAPRQVAQVPLEGVAQGLDIWDDLLAVSAGDAGLYLISLTYEWAPTVAAHLDTDGDAQDVKLAENLAYVADGPAGLVIISLVDRTAPVLRGTLYIPGAAHALALADTFVYVAADDGGLQIVDAIRPASPFLVGALALPEGQRAVDIAMVNKRAYLAIQGSDSRGADTGLAIADVGFRDQPTILSRVTGPGMGVSVRGVDVVTVDGNELAVVDARASSGPLLVGSYQPPVGAGGMDWQGQNLYVSSGAEGPELTVLAVSNSNRLSDLYMQSRRTAGGQVTVVGSQVLVAAGRRGLRALEIQELPLVAETIIYDPMDTLIRLFAPAGESGVIYGAGEVGWSIAAVSNPQLPQPLSRVQTDAAINGLDKAGDLLYAIASAKGLLIYDVADRMQPQLLGQWPGAPLRDVLVRDGYLYLTDRQAGLRVLNPASPAHPGLLQTLPLSLAPNRIVPLPDNQAYLIGDAAGGGVSLVDLGNPTVGVVPQGQFAASEVAVHASGPYLYTLDGDRFAAWSLEEIAAGETEPLASFAINGTRLMTAGSQFFVGSEIGHVSIVDVTSPAEPRVQGMMGNASAVRAMFLDPAAGLLTVGLEAAPPRDLPVATATVGELRVWNVQDPRRPLLLSTVKLLPPFAAMARLSAASRLVAAGPSLILLDVSDPLTATVAAELALPVPALALTLAEDVAYLGTKTGLVVVDGLAADSPAIRGELVLDKPVTDLVVRGRRAYLAVQGRGGLVVDLGDGAAPRVLASLPSPAGGDLQELVLVEDRLWAVWDGWVSWLDVGRPMDGPSEIGPVDLGGRVVSDLVVDGWLAYLADKETGISIWDLRDPAHPDLLGELDTPGHAQAIAPGSNGIGYVADGECGVRVVDLSDPSRPAELGFWQSGFALDVAAQDGQVYVADVGELVVLEYDPAGEAIPPLAPQAPQPADGAMFYSTEIALSWIVSASECDPLVYDLFLGTSNPPPLVASGLVTSTYPATDLERRQEYYWQVVAYDRQGDKTAGPVWRFETRTAAEPPPIPTRAPVPELPPPGSDIVPLLIVGLLAVGLAAGVLWWLLERGRS